MINLTCASCWPWTGQHWPVATTHTYFTSRWCTKHTARSSRCEWNANGMETVAYHGHNRRFQLLFVNFFSCGNINKCRYRERNSPPSCHTERLACPSSQAMIGWLGAYFSFPFSYSWHRDRRPLWMMVKLKSFIYFCHVFMCWVKYA